MLAPSPGEVEPCGEESGFSVVEEEIESSLSDCDAVPSTSVEFGNFLDRIF